MTRSEAEQVRQGGGEVGQVERGGDSNKKTKAADELADAYARYKAGNH